MSPSDVKTDMAKLGYTLTSDQSNAVKNIISGRDVVAIMPTGTGKSMIFLSLAITSVQRKMDFVMIIVTPLKSISYTHKKSFKKVS